MLCSERSNQQRVIKHVGRSNSTIGLLRCFFVKFQVICVEKSLGFRNMFIGEGGLRSSSSLPSEKFLYTYSLCPHRVWIIIGVWIYITHLYFFALYLCLNNFQLTICFIIIIILFTSSNLIKHKCVNNYS